MPEPDLVRTGIDVMKLWYALVIKQTHRRAGAPAEDASRRSAGQRVL